MQTNSFRTYELAVQFYRDTRSCRLPAHLKKQFDRAAGSIALNLHEGWGRATRPDRNRFFQIAFGSIRECQAILCLQQDRFSDEHVRQLDRVAAGVYRLLFPRPWALGPGPWAQGREPFPDALWGSLTASYAAALSPDPPRSPPPRRARRRIWRASAPSASGSSGASARVPLGPCLESRSFVPDFPSAR